MIIPYDQLKEETLTALLEEFVTRQGAVHGHADARVERMIEEVRAQLRDGRAVILFDEDDQTCTIVSREEARAGGRKETRRVVEE